MAALLCAGEEPYVPTAAEEEAIRSGKAPNKRALLKQMQAQRQVCAALRLREASPSGNGIPCLQKDRLRV